MTPWTSAWPARAASPTARSASTWPPTRPSSSPTTTRDGCGLPPTTPWAGCRCGRGCHGWHRDWSTPRSARPASPPSASASRAWRRSVTHRSSPRSPSCSGGRRGGPRTRPGRPAHRPALAGHVQHLLPPGRREVRGPGPGGRRLRRRRPDQLRVLRPHLDLHRSTRHRQAGVGAHDRRAAALAGGRHPGHRSRTVLYGRLPRRRPGAAARGPGRATARRAVPHLRRATAQPRAGRLAAPAAHHVGHRADPLPPARGDQGRRRPRTDAPRRDRRPCPGRRLLRPRRQLRLRTRPLRPVHDRGRARGAARSAGDRPRRTRPRGRLQLPYADRTGRHRPPRPAPGRGPGPRHGRTASAPDHPEKLADRPEASDRDGRLLAAGAATAVLGAAAAGTYWFRNRQSAR